MATEHLVTNGAGRIVNRIVCDETTPADWHPGPGLTLHPPEVQGSIGGSIINGVYTPPPEPEDGDEAEA